MDYLEPESIHLIATDPPYGISFQSAWPTDARKKEKIENDGFEDYLKLLPEMFQDFKRILSVGGGSGNLWWWWWWNTFIGPFVDRGMQVS